MGERAAVPRALSYQDLTVVAAIRQHNFCVMARKLRLVENDFEALDGVVARGGASIALHISRLLGGHRQQLGELIVANLGLRDQDATAQMLDQIGAD